MSFLTTAGFLFIRDFAAFVAVATVDMLAMNANSAADGALLRRVGGEDGGDATVFRSATHAITNVGIALGAVGCAVAVQVGTPDAYRALIAGNALTFLGAWAVSGRLPKYPPLPRPDDGPRWGALADRPFVAYAAHNALMSMQYFVMLTPLPLWMVTRTRAPGWTVGAVLLLNTFIVIAFQVRVGRNVTTIAQGGAALRRAGLLFLVSCGAIGFSACLPGWAALLLIAAAIAVHSVGELHHASGTFALDFGMAPEHAQGQYQGLAGLRPGRGRRVRAGTHARPVPAVRRGRLARPRGLLRRPRDDRPRHRPLGRPHPAVGRHRGRRCFGGTRPHAAAAWLPALPASR